MQCKVKLLKKDLKLFLLIRNKNYFLSGFSSLLVVFNRPWLRLQPLLGANNSFFSLPFYHSNHLRLEWRSTTLKRMEPFWRLPRPTCTFWLCTPSSRLFRQSKLIFSFSNSFLKLFTPLSNMQLMFWKFFWCFLFSSLSFFLLICQC